MSYNLLPSNPKLARSTSHRIGFEERQNLSENSKLTRSVSECYTRTIGRKRVTFDGPEMLDFDFPFDDNKRTCRNHLGKVNRLESLPQELLVTILSGVNQSDLKQLVLVSKTIKEAATIAKETYFAFKTPPPKPVFEREFDSEDDNACYAPKQAIRFRPFFRNKLEDIAIELFRDNYEI